MLSQFMERLHVDLGLEQSLAPNEEGSYSLQLEPNLHIFLRENPGPGITLFTVISPLPEIKKEEFMLKVLAANLLGRETGGAAIGLDKDEKNIVMIYFLPEQLGYKEFHESLEDFVNYAEAWQQETIEFIEQANRKKA